MPLLGILNISTGFFLLFVSSCAGLFLATDAANAFLHDPTILEGWQSVLRVSAHGHTALFGQIQILFGLTLAYGKARRRLQILQTFGISAGSFAMSVLMLLRAAQGPSSSFDVLGLCIGGCLSAYLIALGSHWMCLMCRLLKRC